MTAPPEPGMTLAASSPARLPAPAAPLSERTLQDRIVDWARRFDWLVVHFGGNQHRRAWYDATGFPDLLMIHPSGLVWFRELKSDKAKLTAAQQDWYDRLVRYGADVDVWRPRDWPDIVQAVSFGRGAVTL